MNRRIIIILITAGLIVSLIPPLVGGLNLNSEPGEKLTIDSYLQKAVEEYYAGELVESKRLYKKVMTEDSNNLEALRGLIILESELGNYNKLIKYYDKLIKLAPENEFYKFDYGVMLYQMGNYDKAQQILKKLTVTEFTAKQQSLINYYLGDINLHRQNMYKARDFFTRGVEIYPSLSLNYIGLAEISRSNQKLLEAVQFYRKALNRDRSYSYLYPRIAVCYQQLGKHEKAYQYWKKSLDSGENVKRARENIAELEKQYPHLKPDPAIKIDEQKDIEWVKAEKYEWQEEIPVLAVGLMDNASELNFQCHSEFTIRDNKGNIVLTGEPEIPWKLTYNDGIFRLFKENKLIKKIPAGDSLVIGDSIFAIYNISYGSGYFWSGEEDRQYRGDLQVKPTGDNKFTVINRVNLEEYLLSVVPSEIPAWWPEEALKTQSVAARTYALRGNKQKRHRDYDLCAGVHCAAYRGLTRENSRTERAVLATLGEVITYEDRVIEAVFSSNSGGFSESSKDVWGTATPYLTSVNNTGNKTDFPLAPYELFEWLLTEPPSYSNNKLYTGANTYRWIKTVPAAYYENKYKLDELTNIIPLARSKGGSVVKVVLEGAENEITLSRDKIRSGLGGLRSNRFIIKKIHTESGELSELIFYGSGWGHGVGLDQTAAADMADRGFNYREIINHFYHNIEIKKMY